MAAYYSPSTNLAYNSDWQYGDTWPTDAVVIENKIHHEFFVAPSPDGKQRAVGGNGLPCWIDIPALTKDEMIADAEFQKNKLLSVVKEKTQLWQTQLALGIIEDKDKEMLIKWMRFAQAVSAVSSISAPDIEWPAKPE